MAYFEEKTDIRAKLKKLLKIDRINKKIDQERVKIRKKKSDLLKVELSLKNSRAAVALLIDIRDAIRETRGKKRRTRITKKKYAAIRKLIKKRK